MQKITCKSPRSSEEGHSNKCYVLLFRKPFQFKSSRRYSGNSRILISKDILTHIKYVVVFNVSIIKFDANDYYHIIFDVNYKLV